MLCSWIKALKVFVSSRRPRLDSKAQLTLKIAQLSSIPLSFYHHQPATLDRWSNHPRTSLMFFQIREGFRPKSGKYLAFRTSKAKEFPSWTNLHACFIRRARLKYLISRKPIPPLGLEVQIFLQLSQYTFLLSLLLCLQNLLKILQMSLHKFLSIRKTLIA